MSLSAVWKVDLELCVKILGQKNVELKKNSRSGKNSSQVD